MPRYETLAAQGIYAGKCGDGTEGVGVFAGQRAETFYNDLGACVLCRVVTKGTRRVSIAG